MLCTGNSCRSIMAEALINHLAADRFSAYSAGSFPTGKVHPASIKTLQRHSVVAGSCRSKSWNEFANQSFDYIVTVCDEAAQEACPVFLGGAEKLHWSTPDPACVQGTASDVADAFERTFKSLRARIEKQLLNEH